MRQATVRCVRRAGQQHQAQNRKQAPPPADLSPADNEGIQTMRACRHIQTHLSKHWVAVGAAAGLLQWPRPRRPRCGNAAPVLLLQLAAIRQCGHGWQATILLLLLLLLEGKLGARRLERRPHSRAVEVAGQRRLLLLAAAWARRWGPIGLAAHVWAR